ncbi:MAG: DivIVA domain-containing protein [Oscillospiraceae bacterium]|nr:DivIVA domain-containing protein [Oscillospiraceae bacterium]
MLSVKDINNKRFEQAKTGYRTDEVDDFLREVASEIARYQREKEEDEKKIAVLVESVREYKKDEEALKDALIGAQRQGRAVISEAQAKAEEILAEARNKASEIIGTTKVQKEKEKRHLVKMQQEVSDFKANLLNMYKQHLEQITAIPDYDDFEEEEEAPAAAAAPVQQPAPEPEPEPEPQPAPQQEERKDMEATRVIDNPYRQHQDNKSSFPFGDTTAAVGAAKSESKFGDLKFGQNK